MSFEAVPCMFRSTATDGNSSSYIGLIIRPSSSTTAPQAKNSTVIPTAVGTAPNGIKSLHVVPSTLVKSGQPSEPPKVVVPSGVQLRLQSTSCNTSHCSDSWMQAAPRSNVNTTFDSPSPSQVVPQMSMGDPYDCAMPCASSSSFFPPISSITQSLSSGKSDIDLLQEISPVEVNPLRSQKMPLSSHDFSQQINPLHQYQSAPSQNSYPPQIPVEVQGNRIPSCRYQNGFSGTNDCSATPDSGIQSIAGSPPSTGPFTPPLPSPAPFMTTAPSDVSDLVNRPSASSEDFSDMPRLIPFHQMEEAGSPVGEDAPKMIDATKSEEAGKPGAVEEVDVPKIAITPATNVNDLVEEIMSRMDPEQRKQFANAIQSKVVVNSEASSSSSNSGETHAENPNTEEKKTCSEENVSKQKPRRKKDDSVGPKENRSGNENKGADGCGSKHPVDNAEKEKIERKRKLKEESKRRKRERLEEQEREEKRRREERAREEKERLIKRIQEVRRKEERRLEEERAAAEKREAEEMKAEMLKRQKEERDLEAKKRNEEALERILEHRRSVKEKIDERLNMVLDETGKQLSDLQLNLGPQVHWGLPWYSPSWEEVTQRIAEKSRSEKVAQGKNSNLCKKRSAIHRRASKRSSTKMPGSSEISVTPSASGASEKDKSAAENFTKIKHNVIVNAYPKVEQMSCSCKTGCCGEQDKCLNRMVQMECGNNCPRGTLCSNRRILRRERAGRLKVFATSNGRGVGVKTLDDIKKGQFVCEYVGEVVSKETFDARNKSVYRLCKNHYALDLCQGFVIDAYQKGNITRYVNHSCAPNCEMQRWAVNGQHRIGLFALRDIKKGEELTYDYNWDSFGLGGVTVCSCGAENCRRFLNKNVVMNVKEKEIAKSSRILLLRNVERSANRKMRIARAMARPSSSAEHLGELRSFSEDAVAVLIKKGVPKKQISSLRVAIDASLSRSPTPSLESALKFIEAQFRYTFDGLAKQFDRRKLEAVKAKLVAIKAKHAGRLRKFGVLPDTFGNTSVAKTKRKTSAHRILTAAANLSYLDSSVAVGSYDPDDCTLPLSATETDSDCVRCVCGITDDDGSMVQCDTCHFWLHEDCVVTIKSEGNSQEFTCEMCKRSLSRTPAMNIPLRVQPDFKLEGCTYFRTLVNSRNLQVRLYESVYLQKLENDNHKEILKRLSEFSKGAVKGSQNMPSGERLKNAEFVSEGSFEPSAFSRRDVQCFRVERLFVSPDDHKFVFGCYYARPHEVYCEPGRMFHPKEVFATPLYDTLPLDAVVARCLVLEPRIYALGRPKIPRYDEADVYLCEYQQTGRNSRYFEKIPSRNHYYVNTERHNFSHFPEPLAFSRNFTPFVMEEHKDGDLQQHKSSSDGRSHSATEQCSTSSDNSSVPDVQWKRKFAHLESIVKQLRDSSTGHGMKSGIGASQRCVSPPRKRSRHARR